MANPTSIHTSFIPAVSTEEAPNGDPINAVDVYVSFVKGRGYYLHINPLTLKDGMENYMLFRFKGTSALIEVAPRFNFKRLEQIVSELKGNPQFTALLNGIKAQGIVISEADYTAWRPNVRRAS